MTDRTRYIIGKLTALQQAYNSLATGRLPQIEMTTTYIEQDSDRAIESCIATIEQGLPLSHEYNKKKLHEYIAELKGL